MAKLLFFQWYSFMNKGIENALKKLEIEYDVFYYQFNDWEKDDIFCERFEQQIKKGYYDRVLSVNYAPLVSNICEEHGVSYIAWVYDSPLHIRSMESFNNKCNTIYFFDRIQAEEYKAIGVDARHMPLAVDTEVFRVNPSASQRQKYGTDISLVGKLYQTEYQYYMQVLNDFQRGYLEGIVSAQGKIYGGNIIPELVTDALVEDLNVSYGKASNGTASIGKRELEFMLACETTGRERYIALALLSKHFKTKIYSTENDERLKNAEFCGYADYYGEMPYIFNLSKINLNISLKTIQSGIPLRVVDVMGCGGFVLTNYQQEIAENFVNGEECVIYTEMGDLYEKAKFYLENEEERRRVARNGLEKVKREFTFEDRVRRMLLSNG